MPLADHQIIHRCVTENMIYPYETTKFKNGVISYGPSSYGYDIRLGDTFFIFSQARGGIIDPRDSREIEFKKIIAENPIVIPPNSFVLAHSYEKFKIPRDILGICLGKSTYARCGLIVNVTPLEPEWEGYLTIELSNTAPQPLRIYPKQGIAQLIFFRADEVCTTSYADTKGKYQGQKKEVTLPKV